VVLDRNEVVARDADRNVLLLASVVEGLDEVLTLEILNNFIQINDGLVFKAR
jgi:hypothetical protein